MEGMYNNLEQALGVVVCIFQRYCRKEGNRYTLSRGELLDLLKKELPILKTLKIKEGAFEEFMALLDTNSDGQVDFEEYIRFVSVACTYFHDFFKDSPPDHPRVQ
ncbi:PREDICTED: protein S100-A3-like [Gekko japonicus]|uniref:Protein S100 n=1 Tax=Gekko japonicus TaxID=146911 RepID=A0ABM1K0H3_GEKJA|nr:PREDICTED: protein S100-A3-like [Gekko japonicus]